MESKKNKSGLKKFGSSIKNVFGGKKRRRRKKSSRGDSGNADFVDDRSYVSYDDSEAGDSSVYSYQEAAHNEVSSASSKKRSGSTPSTSLAIINEGAIENDSEVFDASPRRRNRFRGGRNGNSAGDASLTSSKGSRRSKKSSSASQQKHADPLSLVVLLVDPSSLRFELLSLDFDLAASKTIKKRNGSSNSIASPELALTVQDVLNQITPDALTEEKLKVSASKSGGCRALIDRNGQIHFGTASLEKACAARPLRDNDVTRQKCLFPTYTGQPHRDLLLGFFAGVGVGNGKRKKAKSIAEIANDVTRALDLARPIFADPNVVNLMETNGYELTGWKPGTSLETNSPNSSALSSTSKALLPPPQSPQKRRRWSFSSLAVKMIIALVTLALATVLAFALVSGGLHIVPAVSSPFDGNRYDVCETDHPQTFEGYMSLAFDYVLSRYHSYSGVVEDGVNDTTTSGGTQLLVV